MDTDLENFEDLRRDVRRLQRQNRWLAAFSALVGLGLVLSLVMPISTTRSRRFELMDSRNRRQAMWRVRDGEAAMILQDSAGRWRVVLALDDDGPRLDLNSPLGRPVVSLSTPQSQALLTMHDIEGRPRVRIMVTSEGPRMDFLDEEGGATASYPQASQPPPDPR